MAHEGEMSEMEGVTSIGRKLTPPTSTAECDVEAADHAERSSLSAALAPSLTPPRQAQHARRHHARRMLPRQLAGGTARAGGRKLHLHTVSRGPLRTLTIGEKGTMVDEGAEGDEKVTPAASPDRQTPPPLPPILIRT